jgi:hypothetical protein
MDGGGGGEAIVKIESWGRWETYLRTFWGIDCVEWGAVGWVCDVRCGLREDELRQGRVVGGFGVGAPGHVQCVRAWFTE